MAASARLSEERCIPCSGRTKPLSAEQSAVLLKKVPGWKLVRGHLRRTVRFEDFLTLMEFVNEMADLAEEQGHHPDFKVHYSKLDLELWTHAIRGLSRSDFVFAAKINDLLGERG